jgi:AraC family ethanolamine operon transcriptional activator
LPIDLQKALSKGSISIQEPSERDDFSTHVGWKTEYLQLEPGQYSADVNFSIHSDIRLAWSVSNLRSAATATPPADHMAVFLPLANQPQIICQGRTMGKGEVAIVCPNFRVVARFPRDFEMITLTLTRTSLKPGIRRLVESPPRQFTDGVFVTRVPDVNLKELIRVCQKMIEYRKKPHSAGLVNSIKKMELNITELLSEAIVGADRTPPAKRALKNRFTIFHNTRKYINSRLGAPLSLKAIAADAGVSPRTLDYAFQDCLGITPLAYIKARRLAAARRLLLNAIPQETRVHDIAEACGFKHMGHFARDYGLQFLELPSETLTKKSV